MRGLYLTPSHGLSVGPIFRPLIWRQPPERDAAASLARRNSTDWIERFARQYGKKMVPGGGFEPPTRGFSILIRHIRPISSRDTELHKYLISFGFCFLRIAGVFRAFPRRGTGVVPAFESR